MSSRMSLQNLPVEIFNHIIESLVASVGIFKAVRLRSVNIRFNSAIWFAICTRQVIDIKDRAIPGLYSYMPTSLKGGILLSKSYFQETIKEDKALFAIASTSQALDSLTQPNEQHQMISEAVAGLGSYELSRLNRNGQGVDTEEMQAHNLISGAIVIGDLPLVQSLMGKISVNVNVNRENPYFGRPLHTAAAWGRIEIVRYLLDHGADPNRFTGPQGEDNDDDWEHARLHSRHKYRSPEGSALRAAALGGHEKIICFLLEPRYGLSLPRAEYLRTMLAAVRGGHLNIIEIILQSMEISVRELGAFREEMLWEAVRHDQEAVVQMLLAHGTDVNALPYADGRDHGCAIKIAASPYDNPMVIAKTFSAEWIVNYLLSLGAEDREVDLDETPDTFLEDCYNLQMLRGIRLTERTWEWVGKY